MKKIISLLLILTMVFTTVFAQDHAFSDIAGHWAEEEILKACENHIVNGYEDGTFRPDETVSRAEFLKMVACSVVTDASVEFPDVDGSTHWADKYYKFSTVYYLIPTEGVVYNEVSPGNMTAENFDLPIRRWEMAYIIDCVLSNLLSLGTFSYLFDNDFVPADKESIFETYHKNVAFAISNIAFCGISRGDQNGNFNADKTGTRAEAVTIINRLNEVIDNINAEYQRILLEQYEKKNESMVTYTEDQIPEEGTVVLFTLENGKEFEITLCPKDAPQTCANFVALVNDGFYNGLTFHRVVPGFVIQGGDPKGDGTGGSEKNIIGEFSSNDINNTLSHQKGVVSMARSGDFDSASSQFFVCLDNDDFLDGSYAAFGKVTKGLENLEALQTVELIASGDYENAEVSRPATPIVIKSAVVKK